MNLSYVNVLQVAATQAGLTLLSQSGVQLVQQAISQAGAASQVSLQALQQHLQQQVHSPLRPSLSL